MQNIQEYANKIAKNIESLVETVENKITTPYLDDTDNSAENALNADFVQALSSNQHLEDKYLANYYANIAG